MFQKDTEQGHTEAQEQVKRERREQLVERLKKIAHSQQALPDQARQARAMCYYPAPSLPKPVHTKCFDLLTRLGKTITGLITFVPRKIFPKQPIPKDYRKVFALLQESGLDVSYDEGKIVFHLPRDFRDTCEDMVLAPIPDVSILETMVRFLKNDASVTIEDIEKILKNHE